jgi:outer membrane protein assembly factor BamB
MIRRTLSASTRTGRVLPVLLIVLSLGAFAGADWPQFLGPGGASVTKDKGLPTTWSESENIVWKTAMPGFGASSPIVVGDKILVTAYSGYGQGEEKGKEEDLTLHLLCIDAAGGKIVWDKSVKASLPETPYGGFMPLHGYASSTPVSDGKAVYVFFGRTGVFAYSLAGEKLWQADVGTKTHGWGSATSPILAGKLLIVNASVESGAVVALNTADGKEAWRAEDIRDSWSTPALLTLPGGKQELVVSSHGKVRGFDPADGKKLWECEAVPDYICPSVVTHGDVAYVTSSRKAGCLAVRGGGSGDVTSTHKLWQIPKTPNVPSPLYDDGHLYWVSASGIATCVKADDGKIVYEERISGLGRVYGSLLLADGKLYCASREKGIGVVLAAGPEFKELARNDIGDKSVFNATPVPCNGRLLLRSDRFLYYVGK